MLPNNVYRHFPWHLIRINLQSQVVWVKYCHHQDPGSSSTPYSQHKYNVGSGKLWCYEYINTQSDPYLSISLTWDHASCYESINTHAPPVTPTLNITWDHAFLMLWMRPGFHLPSSSSFAFNFPLKHHFFLKWESWQVTCPNQASFRHYITGESPCWLHN